MTIIRNIFFIIVCSVCLPVMGQPETADAEQTAGGDASVAEGVSVEVRETHMPKQPLQQSRLWLPASMDNLMPFLLTAALRAMDNPDCRDVLYGSVNEFRTERDEPTFTILCMQNPRHTFNLIFPQHVLMPSVPEEVLAETREAEAELDRLRNLLQSDATTPDNTPQSPVLDEVDSDRPPPEVF
jgi:hypothetical protein